MNRRRSDLSLVLLFLLPSFAGFLVFNGLPIVGSLALSLTEWNVLSPPRFVGAANYLRLLRDPTFFDPDVFTESSYQVFRREGIQYGLPESFSTVLLFYNKDLFDQARVPYPSPDWTSEDERTWWYLR